MSPPAVHDAGVRGIGVVAPHDCARRGGSSDSGPLPGVVDPPGSSPCSRAGNTPDPGRMAGKPTRLARSAGTDIADSLPPPHAPAHNAGQRRGKQAYRACGEAPTGAPQRRGPGIRVVIGARALAFAADQHNECAHRTRYRGQVANNTLQGKISAPAPNPLGGSEAAGRGRLRPVQPASVRDAHELSKLQWLPRRCLTDNTPQLAHGCLHSYNSGRAGGLPLASRGGLILDSASGQPLALGGKIEIGALRVLERLSHRRALQPLG